MNGIFITIELEGELATRVHALQEEFDPKMARYLPPHVTIIGSSGAGVEEEHATENIAQRTKGLGW